MLTEFLRQQSDYALFLNGIGLIILAITSLLLHQTKKQELPWIWLAGFAILHALSEWMDGIVYSSGSTAVFLALRVMIMTASLVFLLEFGRRSLAKTGGKAPGEWIYLILLPLAAASGWWGLAGINTTVRYLFGVTGGGLAAIALVRAASTVRERWLRLEGYLLAAYILLDCFTAPPAPYGPGLIINESIFSRLSGIPIQVVCAAVVTVLAYMHWQHYQIVKPQLAARDRRTLKNFENHFVLTGGILLALGWLAAWYAGNFAGQALRTDLTNHVNLLKASVDEDKFTLLNGQAGDAETKEYIYLQDKLNQYRRADERIVHMYLMKQRGGQFYVVVDSLDPETQSAEQPGTIFLQPPAGLSAVFQSGGTSILGPYRDERGEFISGFTAIRAEYDERIIGVGGVDIPADLYTQTIYRYRLGTILITTLLFLGLVELTLSRQNSWEANLRIAQSEKRLSEAQTIAGISSWSASGMDQPMNWSREFYAVCGVPPDNGPPTFIEFKRMIHPEDLATFNDAIAKAYQSQMEFEVDFRLQRPDGAQRHLYTRGTARYSMQFEDLLLVAVSQDITERKEADLNVRKFSQVIEQSPIAIVITDPNGHIEYVNSTFSSLTGYSLEEVAGKTPRILKSGETRPEVYSRLWNTILAGQDWSGVFHNRKKSGALYWEAASIFPILSADGKITHFVSFKEDITERTQADEDLRRAHEELAQTNLELQKASQVKSEFLANMSHEIRTPLNAIIGMTGLLLDTRLNNEQRSFSETVRASGEVLLTLINDILDFSKIEAQKLELENQSFTLRRCIEEALDLIVTKASEKRIELAYLVENDLPAHFVGDVTRLRQILVNLLSNAVKFTEHGEVMISVSGQLRDDHLYQLHFAVQDTGIGIPPDRVWRLFQSFSQVDASTTRKYGGTGLGLAISKRLSELMGGTMWVESQGVPGEGSTFHFTIMVQEDREQAAVEPTGHSELPQGLHVLIVDDNKTNREILQHYAQAWHMRSTSASSGREVLELLQGGASFDLAILDLQMPEMDGISLARAIRQMPKECSFPLVMLSSLGYREQPEVEALFAAYLTKPIKPSQLFDSLCLAINQKAPAQRKNFNQPADPFDREMGAHHPLRLLVVEDNSVNQTVALSLLGRIGYRADLASNGIEALDALRRQPYDLIFMDGQMPEMDGVEATRWIRKQWPAEEQPTIVAMTANAMQGDRERYLAAGMDGYISKPIHLEDVVKALLECKPHSAHGLGESAEEPAAAQQVEDGDMPYEGNLESAAEADEALAETPAAQVSERPPVDPSVLAAFQEMMGDDGREMVAQLVQLYLTDSPVLIMLMHSAFDSANFTDLHRAAHTLKGNCNQLGILPLAEISFELEKLARGNALDGAAELIAQIEQEYTRVEAFLRDAYCLEVTPGKAS